MEFVKATKKQSKLKLAIMGPAGSGKSYTALTLATALGEGETDWKIAAIDTEAGSLSLYSDVFNFDVVELSDFHPNNYVQGLIAAHAAGYNVIVIDSLSHAWSGKGGILELKDQAGAGFDKWGKITPIQQRLVDAILRVPVHVILTLRVKTEYAVDDAVNAQGRKSTVPRKIGLAPVQRENFEYEPDILISMDQDHVGTVIKSRYGAIEGLSYTKPGLDFMRPVKAWLQTGAPVTTPEPDATAAELLVEIGLRGAELYGEAWTENATKAALQKSGGVENDITKLPPADLKVIRDQLCARMATTV